MRARILNTFGYADKLDDLLARLQAETMPAANDWASIAQAAQFVRDALTA